MRTLQIRRTVQAEAVSFCSSTHKEIGGRMYTSSERQVRTRPCAMAASRLVSWAVQVRNDTRADWLVPSAAWQPPPRPHRGNAASAPGTCQLFMAGTAPSHHCGPNIQPNAQFAAVIENALEFSKPTNQILTQRMVTGEILRAVAPQQVASLAPPNSFQKRSCGFGFILSTDRFKTSGQSPQLQHRMAKHSK